MKSTLALLSAFGSVALATGVTDYIAPDNSYPSGCSKSYSGSFEVTVAVVEDAAKRDVHKRMNLDTCSSDGALLLTLEGGVLSDAKNRTGYIASNYQFQFDDPPQAGAIYTAGFSICGNDSLALGDSTTWYQCKSGDFYNLYDRYWAAQCEAVQIIAMPCGGSSAEETSDGGQAMSTQVISTQVITTTIVKPLSDGQPQVLTTTIPVPICQIDDGQIQGHTTPCASISVAITETPNTGVPVSQFSDGQIQVTTPAATATVASTPVVEATTPAVAATTAVATTAVATVPTAATTSAVATVSFKTTTSKAGNHTVQTTASTGSATTAAYGSTTTPAGSASTTAVIASEGLRVSVGSMAALAAGLFAVFVTL